MGYAAIYALMNLGIVVIGALSAWVRPGVQRILDHAEVALPANPLLLAVLRIPAAACRRSTGSARRLRPWPWR